MKCQCCGGDIGIKECFLIPDIVGRQKVCKDCFDVSNEEECYCGERGKCSVCIERSVDIGDLLKDQQKDILKMRMVKGETL